jgi:flagellar motor switch protein FliN
MSDGSLSQDEIDALLSGGGGGMDFGGGAPEQAAGAGLTDQEKAAFLELLSSNVGSTSANLSGMVGESVDIQSPTLDEQDADTFRNSVPDQLVEIRIDFQDGVIGHHTYIFPQDIATTIAGKMMGQEDVELNEAALSALEEAGNTVAGSAATSIGDRIGTTVMTAPAKTTMGSGSDLDVPDDGAVVVTYPTTINDQPQSSIIEVFSLSVVKTIAGALTGGGGAAQMSGMDQQQQAAAGPPGGDFMQMQGGGGQGFGQMGAPQQQQPMGGQPQMGFGQPMMGGGMAPPNVQGVQFPNLVPQQSAGDQGNIGLLMDVYMEMTVELGRTRRLIRDILGFGEGTIVELDKLAGEPVDILVNHKPIAKGEVVVIDENFGVRVTEILSPMDRVSDLT